MILGKSYGLEKPEIFGMNAKENLRRIWAEIKGDYSTGITDDTVLPATIANRFRQAFPRRNLAVLIYRDYYENIRYKAMRQYDASFRTSELTPK